MQLSQQKKPFLNDLLYFWNVAYILSILQKKKITLTDFVFPKLRTSNR